LCGRCGERLPDELLFSSKQRRSVQKGMTELKERSREVRERETSLGSHPVDPSLL